MSNFMKMPFGAKEGKKVNIYPACAREECHEDVQKMLAEQDAAGLSQYMMCQGCDKPVIVHRPTYERAVMETELEGRSLVVWCIQCLDALGYMKRLENLSGQHGGTA